MQGRPVEAIPQTVDEQEAAMPIDSPGQRDGEILDPARMPDIRAIEDLGISYANAVDDRDWGRWEALFLSDGLVDYTRAGGIKGTPAEVAEWMVRAMANFAFTLHTTSTHEIRLTGPATAVGRCHVFNRNGVEWDGRRSSSTSAPGTRTPTAGSVVRGGSPAGSSTPPTCPAGRSPT